MGDSFCGWYFKCQTGKKTLAVIPAVHSAHGKRACSIQLITDNGNWNVPFPAQGNKVCAVSPCAAIGGNRFSARGFRLDLHTKELRAEGVVHFSDLTPLRYDIMGPFRYVPFLECRHSVCSMRHRLSGEIIVNGERYRFQNDTGYLEGDRGTSFPKHYLWTQCCFRRGSLMLSVAEIPLGPVRFTGIIGVLLLDGKEYRIATYLGAQARSIENGCVVVQQGTLTFSAALLESHALALRAPQQGAMERTIHESAACHARYRLYRGDKLFFSLDSGRASFEYEYPQ